MSTDSILCSRMIFLLFTYTDLVSTHSKRIIGQSLRGESSQKRWSCFQTAKPSWILIFCWVTSVWSCLFVFILNKRWLFLLINEPSSSLACAKNCDLIDKATPTLEHSGRDATAFPSFNYLNKIAQKFSLCVSESRTYFVHCGFSFFFFIQSPLTVLFRCGYKLCCYSLFSLFLCRTNSFHYVVLCV